MKGSASLITATMLLSACASRDVVYRLDSNTLDEKHSYALVRFPDDPNDIAKIICTALVIRGISVIIVADAPQQPLSDGLIRYESGWYWDVTFYLVGLSIAVYDSSGSTLQAAAAMARTSLSRKTPRAAVDYLLDDIFGKPSPLPNAGTGNCDVPIITSGAQ